MSEGEERLNHLLQSGVITLTGGRDLHKNLILTLPTDKLQQVEEWSVQDLVSLFMCLASISKHLQTEVGGKGFPAEPRLVCVSDLRNASTTCIAKLVDTLEAVEHQQRGTAVSVYFLKPRNKARSHTMKKLLGVKPSKKNPKVPLFKVVLLKTLQELHSHIDLGQLTLDFYGTLQYNHQAFMKLYKVVIQCIKSGQRLLSKLPGVRDRVELLQDYDTDGHSSSQLQQLLSDLTEKFHMIHSESSLPAKLQDTKQTLFSLEHPGVEDQLSSALPKLTEGLIVALRGVYTQLDQLNTEIDEAWRATESKLTLLVQIQKHRERAKEIEHKICQHYQPLLQEHPIVGRTLSQAELYRAHFTTTLHEPAKELLSQATEILEAVQRLKSSESLQSVTTALGRRRGSVAPADLVTLDMTDVSRCLTTSIQPFAGQLQKLQQIYVNVHIFHLLFEKALSWYKKVLKFLPDSLLERCASNSGLQASDLVAYSESTHSEEILLYMPNDWLGAVRAFLNRHPPPRQEHIERLDESIPHAVDKRLKAQARSLALRLRLLQRVMSSTRLPLRLLQAVVSWKLELFGAHSSGQDRPISSQHNATGSPVRERQRGVQFSSGPAEDEVIRGQASGWPSYHQKPLLPEGGGFGPQAKIGRSRRFPASGDASDAILGGSAHTRQPGGEGMMGSSYYGTEAAPSGLEQVKVHLGQHRRSAASRSMLRSKSVDFNFNSSSTDGSVFDYDRAVLGLKEGRGDLGEEQAILGVRQHHAFNGKPHARDSRDHSHHRNARQSHSTIYRAEDQAMSDPSQLVAGDPRSRLSFALSDTNKEDRLSGSSYGAALRSKPERSIQGSLAHPDAVSFTDQQPPRARSAHFPLSSDSSGGQERFIRISLSPRKSSQNSRDEFHYPSNLEQIGRALLQGGGGGLEEEESGFDTAEGDPYDSIVTRIREISSSNYTSVEKLQKVSDLISKSQEGSSSRQHSGVESRLMKTAKSTLDLSRVDNSLGRVEERYQTEESRGSSYHPAQSSPRERPVEVIYKMKQSIAKSMEDLSSSPPRESNPPTRFSNERFHSELRMEPVYTVPRRRGGEVTPSRPRPGEFRQHSMSDVETSKSSPLLTSPGEGGSRTRTGSDIELSFPDPLMQDDWSNVADGDAEGSHTSRVVRPTNLGIPSSRNFISPSFLRPAMSMQDLSSRRPLTAANLDLLQELDDRTGFGTIEDMKMLSDLQARSFGQTHQAQGTAPGSSFLPNTGLTQPKSSRERQETSEQKTHVPTVPPAAANKDIIANFVLFGETHGLALKGGDADIGRIAPCYATSSATSSTSPFWRARGKLSRQASSFSTEDDEGEASRDVLVLQNKINLNRLSLEAQQEHISQEDVAQSLKNTQRILENEEKRQQRGREPVTGVSFEEGSTEKEEREGGTAGFGVSGSTSVDNGYSSWASRLVSTLSTSSEGVEDGVKAEEAEAEVIDEDWEDSSVSEDTYSDHSEVG